MTIIHTNFRKQSWVLPIYAYKTPETFIGNSCINKTIPWYWWLDNWYLISWTETQHANALKTKASYCCFNVANVGNSGSLTARDKHARERYCSDHKCTAIALVFIFRSLTLKLFCYDIRCDLSSILQLFWTESWWNVGALQNQLIENSKILGFRKLLLYQLRVGSKILIQLHSEY